MVEDLLIKLERKIEHSIQVIELLRLQIETLEEENMHLKAEHEKWRSDLTGLLNRLDHLEVCTN